MINPTTFETVGNVELLSQNKLAIFASRSTDDEMCEYATEVFLNLIKFSITIASGWQAPLEKDLFSRIPNQCTANFIYYIGKDINLFKPTVRQKKLIEKEKLLVIAPGLKEKRTSSSAVKKRDELLFSQIKRILFLYIEKNGRLEKYYNQISTLGYQIYMLDHPSNKPYLLEDVISISNDTVSNLIVF